MYVFDGDYLATGVAGLTTDNVQGEEYLTDLVGAARDEGRLVAALAAPDPDDTLGINDRAQLAAVESIMRARINLQWIAGVTMRDPGHHLHRRGGGSRTRQRAGARDDPAGSATVAAGAVIGPDSTLIDTVVGAGARVNRVHSELADMSGGDGRSVHVPASCSRSGRGSQSRAFVEIEKRRRRGGRQGAPPDVRGRRRHRRRRRTSARRRCS